MADLKTVEELVNRGAEVQAVDRIGRRPIHFALYKTLDYVKFLQARGAGLAAEDTLLCVAHTRGIEASERGGIINELKANGAEILISAQGVGRLWSPLSLAWYYGAHDIVNLVMPTDEQIMKLEGVEGFFGGEDQLLRV
ncbi:hypothetical protein BBP40_002177 [Aspergillus hancockii]|nr:hypothetical protein BBP40_002177 [Aspergillus hancockii]